MKYVYYIIAIIVIAIIITLISSVAHANFEWVRAQYQGAVRCYRVGQEPVNMKYKHYYETFEECDKTIGHAV